MHLSFILLLPALCCLPLAVSDFRCRRVAIGWLLALGASSFAAGAIGCGLRPTLVHTFVNTLSTGLAVGASALWMSIRRVPLRRFFFTAFGAGDAAMLCALAPLFTPAGFVRFLVAACLLALAAWAVAGRKRRRTIPLAGILALALIGQVASDLFLKWS